MKKADIERVKRSSPPPTTNTAPVTARRSKATAPECDHRDGQRRRACAISPVTGGIGSSSRTERHRMIWQPTEAYRTQFWAEAKAIWESGEKLYLEETSLMRPRPCR